MIDAAHLAELDAVLGRVTTDTLIAPMLEELGTVPDTIRRQVADGDPAAARATAHGLRGAALGLGCIDMAELCGRIETEAVEALPALVQALAPVAAATAESLRRRN